MLLVKYTFTQTSSFGVYVKNGHSIKDLMVVYYMYLFTFQGSPGNEFASWQL